MNKEQYVTYELAKLLKEKGFDWRVFNFYDEHGIFSEHIGSVYSLYNWNYPTKDEYGSKYCSAPTHETVCDWLRKKHNILVCVIPYEVGVGVIDYTYCIYRIICDDLYFEPLAQGRIEEAMNYKKTLEAGLEFVLINVI